MSETTTEERVPCHEVINVLEQRQLYKTAKWWSAVVLGESFGKKSVSVYLWQNKDGTWKQQSKLKINRAGDWLQMKPIIDELVQKL